MRWRNSLNLSEVKPRVILLTPHQGVGRINMLMQVEESDTMAWSTAAKHPYYHF